MKKGKNGQIFIKVNSVTDKEIICKLQEASKAGVDITMLVRGICCILPGIPGLTENIKVYSIVGRFLEHSRIYSFGKGEEQKLFIASADIMTRNMDNRVEVGCPIYSQDIKDAINHYIRICLSDTVKARVLQNDGTYDMKPNVQSKINCQEVLLREAISEKINRQSIVSLQPYNSAQDSHNGFFKRLYASVITKLYNNLKKDSD